jgi:methylmalonyl-CoA mutase
MVPLWNTPKEWKIIEPIAVLQPESTHAAVLQALEGGAEGLSFSFNDIPNIGDFLRYTTGVYADYVSWHFGGKGLLSQPGAVFSCLEALTKDRGTAGASLQGSVQWNPLHVAAPGLQTDWRYAADLIQYTKSRFPNFRVVGFAADFHNGNPVAQLQQVLQNADTCLREITKKGVSAAEAMAGFEIELPVGRHYFLEIAKFRALHLLWYNWLQAKNVSPLRPSVSAVFAQEAYDDALYTNMIRATTMAMSGVLGGADRLTVTPYDAFAADRDTGKSGGFGNRIARNVQHLLKMESHLDRLADPAAGSYYIEHLTRQIAEKVWESLPDEVFE